jgi:TolA-binding protein
MSRTYVAVLCALTLLQVGCWTSASAGDELRQQGAERDRRLERLEASVRATGEQLDAKIAQLEEVLQRATTLLARNSADSGAKLDEAQQQLAALQGQLAELRNDHDMLARSAALRGSDLEQRIDRLSRRETEPEQVQVPADKAAHLALARGAFAGASRHSVRSTSSTPWRRVGPTSSSEAALRGEPAPPAPRATPPPAYAVDLSRLHSTT